MNKGLQKRLIILSMAFFVLIIMLVFQVSYSEARSLEIIEVEIHAEILPEGDLKVIENRTIEFTGQFRGTEQVIYFAGISSYSQIVIREGEHYYTYVEDFPTSEPGTYAVKVFGADYFIVDWSFDAYNERRTFTLEYIARDAVVAHNDVAELYYTFIGDQWDYQTSRAVVTLTIPEETAEGDLLAWGHGPYHGDVDIIDPKTVTWTVSPLPAYTFLEGRVVFPLDQVPGATDRSGEEGLPSILDEEKRWAREANYHRLARRYQIHYSLSFLLIVPLALFSMWKRASNRSKAFKGEYYRELPASYPPEAAGYLWHKKKIQNEFLSAGILNLARQGYLRIEEITTQNTSRKKGEDDFRLVELRKNESPGPINSQVLEFLFKTVYEEYAVNNREGSKEITKAVTFSQIRSFAQKKPSVFHSFYQAWRSALSRLGEQQQFFTKEAFRGWGCLPLVLMIIVCLAAFWWELYILSAVMLVSPLVIFFASPNIHYTDYGADQLSKWKAFRRFLLHFSRLEHSTVPSLVIWEHYLVYAVVLGIARQVIEQLTLVFPDLDQESNFNQTSWSAFRTTQSGALFNSVNSLTRSINTTMNSAARTAASAIAASSGSSSSGRSSSGSGSGGGFSRGGGGGRSGGGGRFR